MTSKQRAHLRSLAPPLKPVVHVGRDGVSDAVVENLREAFNTREVLKVKVQQGAPVEADEAADALRDWIEDAHIVQVIGRTIVLYRPHRDTPEIELPE